MIAARIADWKRSRLGRTSLRCMVRHDGQPLEGAEVKFVPESFLGTDYKTATGVTDQNGVAMMSVPTDPQAGPPGVPPGFYRVEITKSGLKIPAKYNSRTILGVEVALDSETARIGAHFDLSFSISP